MPMVFCKSELKIKELELKMKLPSPTIKVDYPKKKSNVRYKFVDKNFQLEMIRDAE